MLRAYYILIYSLFTTTKKVDLELNMNETEICYLGSFCVPVRWRKEMETMSQKDGHRAVIPCPEVSFGEDYFYHSFDLSQEDIFLPHPSMFVFLVFFIDNYFGSFRHQSSRFFYVSTAHRSSEQVVSGPKVWDTQGIQKVIQFCLLRVFLLFLIFSLRHREAQLV